MNSVKLIGNLPRDPEVRYTKTGKPWASFTVAVSRSLPAAGTMEAKEFTDFIPVVVWGKLAEFCGNNLAKGTKVFVEGRLNVRSYEANDGQKRWVTEVVANFVAQNMDSEQVGGGAKTAEKADFGAFGREVDNGEEIPF